MASLLYTTAKRDLMAGTIDLNTDTIYVMLMAATYTTVADASSHDFRDDVTAHGITATAGDGYTAGGVEITSPVVSADLTNNLGYYDGADVAWADATLTARGAVVYKSTGDATTDPLVCWFDFGSDQTATSGTFTIQWSTDGLIKLS